MTKARSNATANAAKGDLRVGSGTNLSNILAVGNDGEQIVADSSTSTGLRWQGNYAAGKNAILNGDFYINQRNFTSNTTSGAFGFDRWQQSNVGGTYTVTPQTFTPGAAPVSGYEGKTFVQAVTASQSAAGDLAYVGQNIESVRTFAGQTITLSFWAKANTGTPKIAVSLGQIFGTGGSPSASASVYVGQATLSTSWARYSLTYAMPSISGKTIGTNNNDYVQLALWTSAGSTYNALTGSLGIQNFTASIWGVQVEAGSVATAFQTATGTLQGELAACQRYYIRMTGSNYGIMAFGNMYSASRLIGPAPLPVTMRVSPTSLDYSNIQQNDFNGGVAVTSAALYTGTGNQMPTVDISSGGGMTANRFTTIQANNNSAGYLGFSAEL